VIFGDDEGAATRQHHSAEMKFDREPQNRLNAERPAWRGDIARLENKTAVELVLAIVTLEVLSPEDDPAKAGR
jgi:hypothetical protein